VATGREVRHFPLAGDKGADVVSLALSADGQTLAGCAGDESVRVWDVGTGKEAGPLKDPPPAAALLALDATGKTLAVYGQDGSLALWDLESGRRVRRLRDADEGVGEFVPGGHGTLTFSPDGKDLVATRLETGKEEFARSVLRVWDTGSGKERLKIAGPKQTNGAFTPAFSPDGKLLGWAGTDGVVRLVDAATGKEVRKLRTDAGGVRFAFAPDGQTLVTRSEVSREVVVWELATSTKGQQAGGKELRTFAPKADSSGIASWGLAGVVQGMAVSPDARVLALAGEGCAASLMDLESGQAVNVSGGHRAAVSAVTYLADGKGIASRGDDGTIRLWDATTGKQTGEVAVPQEAMTYVLSPDANALASTGLDNVLRVWDARSGKERHQLTTGNNGLVLFDFSPDGKTLAVTDPGDWSLRLYDVAGGKRTLSVSLGRPGDLPADVVRWAGSSHPFFSADGRLVAACVPTPAVVVWDARTGREVRRVSAAHNGSPAVTAACFAPDARTLALERPDGSLVLWELTTGKERVRLGEPTMPEGDDRAAPFRVETARLAYSPDGRFLAQVRGRVVRLWDVVTRKDLGQFKGHVGEVAVLAFAPDGKTLTTGGADGTGLVWDVTRLAGPAAGPAAVKSEAVATAWQALAGEDAARAFEAMSTLAGAPGQAVPFLREHLKPAAVPDEGELARRIAELDSDEFVVRQAAAAALRKAGPTAAPALRKALTANPSAQVKQQAEVLLADLDQVRLTGDELRAGRAVEVLEMIGTPEARQVLTALAGGAAGARATEAAKAALERQGQARGIAPPPGKSGDQR
jgi:WD40 repeat protein